MAAGDADTVADPRIRTLVGRLSALHRELLEALTLADLVETPPHEPAAHPGAAVSQA